MTRRLNSLFAVLPLTIILGACTTDSDESVDPVTDPTPGFYATFRPDLALVPFPNDIWRNGSTDGTLNIYAGNEQFQSDPLISQVEQMNLLDGFGLNSVIHADFNEPIDEETLAIGQTVFVFAVAVGGNPIAPAPVGTFEVGTAGFQGGESVVELDPTAPLDPLTTYAVFLTNGIQSTAGDDAHADSMFQAMLDAFAADEDDLGDDTLNAIYDQMVEPLLTAADPLIGAENVVMAWTFTTQSTTNSLDLVSATAQPQDSAFAPLLRDPANPGAGIRTAGELLMPASDLNADGTPDIGMNADVYAGVITMPYYLDPENPLTSYWQPVEASCDTAIDAELIGEASASTTAYCPLPEVQATISVPVLLTVPNAASGCAGAIAGVTIFQHGITQNRTNLLPLAQALSQACHAGIAIDLPLHGITDTTSGLYASTESALNPTLELISEGITDAITEQTFDLDVDEEEGIDPSGSYFINLESPITARDSLRQAAANLIHLTRSIDTIDYNVALAALDPGFVGADFTGLPIRFVGHSLGGITGTTYLGVDATADAAVLVAPGGDVADLILDSASIYPQVAEGLAENGLVPGMRFFDEFFRNAQTLIEAGDPINYAAAANTADRGVLLMEVIGGAGVNPDQVVPNSATDKLADVMGLTQAGPGLIGPAPDAIDALVRFVAGDHGSILSPAASLNATEEMQTQVANFVGSGGHALPVGSVHPEVIDAP